MKFDECWADLFGQLLTKHNLPAETLQPTPDDVAGVLLEPWMADSVREFVERQIALWETGGGFRSYGVGDSYTVERTAVITADGKRKVVENEERQTIAYSYGSVRLEGDSLAVFEGFMAGLTTGSERLIASGLALNLIREGVRRGAFESIQDMWIADSKDGLKHPLAALIEGWLNRPPIAVKNKKKAPIITQEHFQIREFVTLETDIDAVSVGQAMLPGLETLLPDYDEMEIFPVLALFDALRGSDREGPLGLRLLITILTEIDVLESVFGFDNGVLVPTTLRGITSHIWPRRFDRRYMPRLRAAMLGWEHAGVPVEYGGLRRVIGTVGPWIAIPDNFPMDREIIFQVYLPPDAKQGAIVHRETLDWLGASHGPMYRAHLTLSHQWWRGARTKGKGKDGTTRGTAWPYATRPVRLQDGAGNPIIKNGRTVPGDPNGPRETNPMIQYLPSYNDDRLLRLFYSPTQLAGAQQTGHLHTYLSRADKYVHKMNHLGLLEMSNHGGQLKLCPPRGWGENFQTPVTVKQLGTRKRGNA